MREAGDLMKNHGFSINIFFFLSHSLSIIKSSTHYTELENITNNSKISHSTVSTEQNCARVKWTSFLSDRMFNEHRSHAGYENTAINDDDDDSSLSTHLHNLIAPPKT